MSRECINYPAQVAHTTESVDEKRVREGLKKELPQGTGSEDVTGERKQVEKSKSRIGHFHRLIPLISTSWVPHETF